MGTCALEIFTGVDRVSAITSVRRKMAVWEAKHTKRRLLVLHRSRTSEKVARKAQPKSNAGWKIGGARLARVRQDAAVRQYCG